jgi:aerobic C4-dicarboxylate transport protein
VRPGSGFNVDPSTLDASAVAQYAGAAKSQSTGEFIAHIVPSTVVDAFAKGDILQVLFVSLLFGFALSLAGPRCKPLLALLEAMTAAVFRVVALLMRVAPIGAFGAMAFTVGKYGLSSLRPLLQLTLTLYITSFLFIVLVLGLVARVAGFGILRLLWFLREEIVLVLATSSSEPVLPSLMAKLEKLGCSKALVGLVVPTGYTFNADGTSLYMTLAALFVAQATNTHLTLMQQLTILGIALLTSKGASGVQGAAFVALVATLTVIPTVPVASMALILGIDRFLSMCRAVVNMIGNAIATLVVARWESELDVNSLRQQLRANS